VLIGVRLGVGSKKRVPLCFESGATLTDDCPSRINLVGNMEGNLGVEANLGLEGNNVVRLQSCGDVGLPKPLIGYY
jgi:hypothetical protein